MRLLLIALLAAPLVFIGSGALRAGTLGIPLSAETRVQGDSICLAALLPPGVPLRIREAAREVSLGAAPQSGSVRQLGRAAVVGAIEDAGLRVSDFQIPEVISVRRSSRFLTRDEVFAAISASLAKNPLAGLPDIHLEDIDFGAVRVPLGNAALEVTEFTFDPFINRARFRLWPRSAPGVLPFYVTAELPSAAARALAPVRALHASLVAPFRVVQPVLPVLVMNGHRARLFVHSADSQMLLQVQALQPGRLGDVIRVRLLGTARIFQARVVAPGYLEAAF